MLRVKTFLALLLATSSHVTTTHQIRLRRRVNWPTLSDASAAELVQKGISTAPGIARADVEKGAVTTPREQRAGGNQNR